MKKVAIVTLDGFNEMDSMIAFTMLNRLNNLGLVAEIVSTHSNVVSMNGLRIQANPTLERLEEYDGVIFGSSKLSNQYAENSTFISSFQLDPDRQYIGAQCSGVLLLIAKGIIGSDVSISTDLKTESLVSATGLSFSSSSFSSTSNIATAGGCLAAEYLASWMALNLLDINATRKMLASSIPKDEMEIRIDHTLNKIRDI
ncbi:MULTISPECIES: DJ-1/PfpI family protein [unclassified Grimontia]|uniref:DJ-1/PfpI family protein n=1 Tax=unclassified Grimontia TaxID=2644349 RepID=UPI0006966171|nr:MULTISPECIES: DJ-1/PfpI family protein [unclassified Grimontia]